jgi:hypothetical protein
MTVRLTESFELTNERPSSFSGELVLVNRSTGKAYSPGDFFEPFSSWGFKPAVTHVARMSKMKKHTNEEIEFIKRF